MTESRPHREALAPGEAAETQCRLRSVRTTERDGLPTYPACAELGEGGGGGYPVFGNQLVAGRPTLPNHAITSIIPWLTATDGGGGVAPVDYVRPCGR